MPGLRFVHAADLHLDSQFKGLERFDEIPSAIVDQSRGATFKAYDNLIQFCLNEQVDFLLVAGDVYDGADRSLRAQLRFRDGLIKLSEAGISSYVVHGNHDPLDGWTVDLRMPGNVHIFGGEVESVPFIKNGRPAARIHGVSYPRRDIDDDFGLELRRSGDEPFQIGLFHCNVGGRPGHDPYAPRTLEQLIDADLDYWALGHIHKHEILSPESPCVVYSGNLQGRHVNEDGPRGCYLVEVSETGGLRSTPKFIALEAVRWSAEELDVGGIDNIDDLMDVLEETLATLRDAAAGNPVVARIKLTGASPLFHLLSRPDQLQDVLSRLRETGSASAPFVWIQKLDCQVKPTLDLEKLRESNDFFGDLLKLIRDYREDPELTLSLNECLAELYQHGRGGKLLEPLEISDLRQLLDEAEGQCAELLLEGD